MQYYIRDTKTAGFQGPMTAAEIAEAVADGRLGPDAEAVEAIGQTSFELKRETGWRPVGELVGGSAGVPPAGATSVDQLVFVGLNGYAVALDRDTGDIVWSNDQLKSGYVTLLLDGDRLVVSTNGYLFCLDPLTGRILWQNRMSGYGGGAPTSLISVRGQSSQVVVQQGAAAMAQAAAAGS